MVRSISFKREVKEGFECEFKMELKSNELAVKIIILIFVMGKEVKSEVMGKVYREFSRQKYNKYKAQFPKLRES